MHKKYMYISQIGEKKFLDKESWIQLIWAKAKGGFKPMIYHSQAWYFNHWAMIIYNKMDSLIQTI